MNDSKMNTYTFKGKRGIDDLQNIYAWTGGSQGDEGFTNKIEVGLASNGWMIYRFKDIDITDQNAIYEESIRRLKANITYIRKLIEEGHYGEEFEMNMHIKPNPIFDNPIRTKINDTLPLESSKLIFLDDKDNLSKGL